VKSSYIRPLVDPAVSAKFPEGSTPEKLALEQVVDKISTSIVMVESDSDAPTKPSGFFESGMGNPSSPDGGS